MMSATDSITVTLIDGDEAESTELLKALRQCKVSVQSARSVPEGLQLLRKRPTPIIISDLHAPGEGQAQCGGLTLVDEVKRHWPESSVMLLARDEDTHELPRCLAAGVNRLLHKPVSWPELRFAIDASFAELDLRRATSRHQRQLERRLEKQSSLLKTRLSEAITSLFITLEFRDPITHSHSRRVKRYAILLARHLGMEKKHVREMGLAAKLHDIGKIAIDENILRKPGNLTTEEIQAIQAHPVIGENIVKPIVRMPNVLAAIRGHHERLDGCGYPDQLAGSDIPLEARLLSVVDCFDALTSCRPYRDQPLRPLEAIKLLHDQTDGHLDPSLVTAFQRVIEAQPRVIQEIQDLV